MAKKLTIGSNEVVVPEKSDISTQISTAINGKLDKVTNPSSNTEVYGKTTSGNQLMIEILSGPLNNAIVQRRSNALIAIKSGNKASRPTTTVYNGDQYFNTDTKQMEVYIGDANHWLNQVYKNGDTLPTPPLNSTQTYILVCYNPTDEGLNVMNIGGQEIFGYNTDNNGTIIVVSNLGGYITITNSNGKSYIPSNFVVSSDFLALKRVA